MQVVVVVGSGIEHDASQLPEVVQSLVDIDHRVEAQSPDSMAKAPKTSGLREPRFHAPNPPEEKPKTLRLRAVGIIRQAASTAATTSCSRYC